MPAAPEPRPGGGRGPHPHGRPPRAGASRVVVTGFGVFSPVGMTAWRTVLSLRAGIQRFGEYEKVQVPDDPAGSERRPAVVAHAPLPLELTGAERARALLSRACTEALGLARLDPAHQQRAGRWLDTPFDDAAAFGVSTAGASTSGLRHCRVHEAAVQAAEALRAGAIEVALVGSADSFSTAPVLLALHEAGRLKSGANAEGLLAGEAGGAVVLETEEHACARGARIYARLTAWGRGQEPHPWSRGLPSRAEGLTAAFAAAMAMLPAGSAVGLVMSDLNGERARALEWGLAQLRIFAAAGDSAPPRLWRPGDGVGDCGAATGAVQIACAAVFLSLGYVQAGRALVTTSDDDGARRVLGLERGDPLGSVAEARTVATGIAGASPWL